MDWRTGKILVLMLAPLAAVSPASAETAQPFDWRGFYLGYHLGGALDLADVDNPLGPSSFGDTVRAPGALAGGQAGYNWQDGSVLYGVEADVSWADLGGTNTCFAHSGFYISANCRTQVDALGTITARLGYILPFDGRTVIFGKAGLAWAHRDLDAVPNGGFGLASTNDSGVEWGWTVGGGGERAIAPRWSVKAEYGFLSFDGHLRAPDSVTQPAPPTLSFAAVQGARTGVSEHIHLFKVGMNYKLGPGQSSEAAKSEPVSVQAKGYTFVAGVRYVYGWGQFHKDLGIQYKGVKSLASRLTYDATDQNGAEGFGRLDTPFGLMVKGLYGGAKGNGRMNDEDWGIKLPGGLVPYSNTVSSVDDDIHYGIIDVGYAAWRGERHSVSPFVGYFHFTQAMKAGGCRQLINRFSDCVPTIPESSIGITENDTWKGVRLGAVADVALAPRLTFSGEAAYLPYVKFEGTDDHVLRSLVSPEDGEGIGVQLEAMLSYAVTHQFELGIGGRYWSMWTTSGHSDFGGTGTIVPQRFAAEQAHLLVQASYKFGFNQD